MVERSPRDPLDEEAAWAEIVAGYGERPPFPAPDKASDGNKDRGDGGDGTAARPAGAAGPAGVPGTPGALDLTKPGAAEAGPPAAGDAADDGAADGAVRENQPKNGPDQGGPGSPAGTGRPGGFIVFAPGVGPRDWSATEPSDDDFDASDEGHFTPPEPPPLPSADVTTKFAWLAVLGGPLLLVLMMLFQQPVTWWIAVLGIGGFLGGFATLVARMKHDDEDDDDVPGSGAVV
ncbi:hypothetical protein ACFVTP_21485 [Streptomyces celluloflavus]|uniref:hypothetical protein n=1 Tax=Streptomyces celluloflavus TaxID=58344 RepID=UPI0036DC5B7B